MSSEALLHTPLRFVCSAGWTPPKRAASPFLRLAGTCWRPYRAQFVPLLEAGSRGRYVQSEAILPSLCAVSRWLWRRCAGQR